MRITNNLLSTKIAASLGAAILTIGGVTTASNKAFAAAPASPITVTGLVDMYYQWSTNNPKSGNLTAPAVNYRQNQPTLDLGQLDINYAAPATGGFAAHATLINGDTANLDAVFGNGPGPSTEYRFRNVIQAYGTLVNKTGWGADFGKFYTPFGYEATNDSNLNPNYSFSDVYFDLLPVYNAGFRFYTPTIWNGWVFKGYVVNALNDTAQEGIHDDNNSKGLFAVASYTDPKGKFTFTENYGFSHDQNIAFGTLVQPGANIDEVTTGIGNKDDTTLSDTDLVLTPNSKVTLGGEFVYRQDSGTDMVNSDGDFEATKNNQVSQGYAAYLVFNTTATSDWAFRYSDVNQKAIGKPYDLTATYAMKSKDGKWLTKLEYRYDHISIDSNNPNGFEDSSGTVPFPKTSGNTFTLGEVYTF